MMLNLMTTGNYDYRQQDFKVLFSQRKTSLFHTTNKQIAKFWFSYCGFSLKVFLADIFWWINDDYVKLF